MADTVPSEVKGRYQKLKETIDHHRYLYHVLDKPEISEAALDSLKHELVLIESQYPALITPDSPSQRVAGKPLKEFIKVVHKVPQWSFNDAFSEEEIRDFDARVRRFLNGKSVKAGDGLEEHVSSRAPAALALGAFAPPRVSSQPSLDLPAFPSKPDSQKPTYTCELKIDGLKIVLEYEKGLLKRAATRGDGKIGEDVTMNVRTIQSVPLRLTKPIDIIVEGEVWMSKKNFAALNAVQAKQGKPLFANPRNVTAGSIRQLDPKMAESRKLDTFIYDVARASVPVPPRQNEELLFLRDLGFKVNPNFKHCDTIDEVIEYWKTLEKKSTEGRLSHRRRGGENRRARASGCARLHRQGAEMGNCFQIRGRASDNCCRRYSAPNWPHRRTDAGRAFAGSFGGRFDRFSGHFA